jgi:transposase
MLTTSPATRVWLAAGATDLRAGFDRLCILAESVLGQQASSGHLFVFCNASRTRVRILYFDGTGLWLLTKRLERGRFAWPAAARDADPAVPRRMTLSHSELLMLLSGIDLAGTTRRSWWRKEQVPPKVAETTRNGSCSYAPGSGT